MIGKRKRIFVLGVAFLLFTGMVPFSWANSQLPPSHNADEGSETGAVKAGIFYPSEPKGDEAPQLEIFGHKFFSEEAKAFSAAMTLSVSEDYVVGPGDEIKVLMWGRIDKLANLKVDRAGKVILPKVGEVSVGGLSFREVSDLIESRLEAISGVNVSVSLGVLKFIQVFVLGEVKNPGVYTISAPATALKALHISGGPTELGSLREVRLKREGKVISRMDIYDLLLEGDVSTDQTVHSGDIIFVPQAGPMVGVSGNVRRPAIYELKNKRSLKTAIALAAGLRPSAYRSRIQVARALDNKEQVVLDISGGLEAAMREFQLQDGDLISVSRILPDPVNAVYLYGNVRRPGEYAYAQGFRIMDVLPHIESLGLDSYMAYAVVRRYCMEDMAWKVIPFSPQRLYLKGEESQNILLEPKDEIHIFKQEDFENKECATISGSVRKPGKYELSKEMTIRDLIYLGGGVMPGAYLKRGEVVRYHIVQGEKVKTSISEFDVARALKGEDSENRQLMPHDEVYIKEIPGWGSRKKTMVLSGEIVFPGTYGISDNESLDTVLKRAGGATPEAYLRGAIFTRESIKEREQRQLEELIKGLEMEIAASESLSEQPLMTEKEVASLALSISAKKALLAGLRETKPSGRVVIPLLSEGQAIRESENLWVWDGDSLHIPKNPGTISVTGAVYHPTAYVYDAKRPYLAYYLAKSGGPTKSAWEDQMYVLRVDGTVVSKTMDEETFEETKLFPGDAIIVPRKGLQPAHLNALTMGQGKAALKDK